MKTRIFLTFPSSELEQKNSIVKYLIELFDKNKEFEISYRWFDEMADKKTNDEIFESGIRALLASDIIVAEASTQSTGVGQQIAFGMFHKIPVLVLVNKEFEKTGRSLFLKGTKTSQVSFYRYQDQDDLNNNLIPVLKSKIEDSYEKLNFMATKSIKKLLITESKKRLISQSELLRQIITTWKNSSMNFSN